VPAPIVHRIAVAVDCECGVTVEACDDEELLDELLEHIAVVHEEPMRGDAATLVRHEAYEL
jgi:predicted small metal-binding protein